MSHQLRCTQCGKGFTLTRPQEGSSVMCTACGSQIELPPELVLPAARRHAGDSRPPAGPFRAQGAGTGRGNPIDPAIKAPGTLETVEGGRRVRRLLVAGLAVALLACAGWLIGKHIHNGDDRNAELVGPTKQLAPAQRPPGHSAAGSAPATQADISQRIPGLPQVGDVHDPATQQVPPANLVPGAPTTRRASGSDMARFDATDPRTVGPSTRASAIAASAGPATRPAPAQLADAAPKTRPATRPVYLIGPPPPFPAERRVTDAQIEQSMRGGINIILSQFEENAITLRYAGGESRRGGLDALCLYALLSAGQSIKDDRLDPKNRAMKLMLEKLKAYRIEPNASVPFDPVTYGKSLRAMALSVYDRPVDRKVFKDDVTWLINEEEDGAYSYGGIWSIPKPTNIFGDPNNGYAYRGNISQMHVCHPNRWNTAYWDKIGEQDPANYAYLKPPVTIPPAGAYVGTWQGLPPAPPGGAAGAVAAATPAPWSPAAKFLELHFPWDNSNSQYGLLGVWAGEQAGLEVPARYWRDIEGHWLRCELRNGQWGYKAPDRQGSLAMTCAGVTSLMVTHDYIQSTGSRGGIGREPSPPPLAAGLAWLEQSDNAVNVGSSQSHYVGYDLFGIERVAMASGFKYFGAHDWYRELAGRALMSQWRNGAWGRTQEGQDALIDTAYVVAFLAQGRHPVFMNKLRFDGYWCNYPRDISSLTHFASHNTERPLNWQVVTLEHGWEDWMDCPVLYLASHKPPKFTESDYGKLRGFVEAGGLLFTHADGDSSEFTKWVTDTLVPKVCPGYALNPVSAGHPIFHVNYEIPAEGTKLMAVDNGSRLLLVHSPVDMAKAWQAHFERVKKDDFRLGVNIFFYAAGKANLRNRFSSPVLPRPPPPQTPRMPVARLKYAGNWNPEPHAWTRFARACRWDTGLAVAPLPVDLTSLAFSTAPIADLTGTASVDFTDEQAKAVAAYVQAGGILLIDDCGGSGDFAQSIQNTLLPKAFPGVPLQDLAADHPLLKGVEMTPQTTDAPRMRPYAIDHLRLTPPRMQGLTAGKGAVLFSSLDLTTGLLGTNTWGVMGYDPAACTKLVENAMIWAARRSQGE